MKKRRISFLSFLLAGIGLLHWNCSAGQEGVNKAWPKDPSFANRLIRSPSDFVGREGFILLKTGDTVKGTMRLPTYNDYMEPLRSVSLLPSGKTRHADIEDIPLSGVSYIAALEGPNSSYTYFTPFRNSLWMVLTKKDKASIYYQRWWQNENDGSVTRWDQMMLVLDTGAVEIPLYNKLGIIARKKMILGFINKRYGQHFSTPDFKSENAMIGYILDRENSR